MAEGIDELYESFYFTISASNIQPNIPSELPLGIDSITTDENGETIIEYIYDTTVQNGTIVEKSISIPDIIPAPTLDFTGCNVLSDVTEYGPTIHSFNIKWEPLKDISHYKVFWAINTSPSVFFKGMNDDIPLNVNFEPLFIGESAELGGDIYEYQHTFIQDSIPIINVSIFLFAYTTNRCDFPLQMIHGVLLDRDGNSTKTVYLRKTTYDISIDDLNYIVETDLRPKNDEQLYVATKEMLAYS